MNPNIHTTWATGDEIRNVADRIQTALDGVTPEHALITMLSLIIIIQRPNISPENLQTAVNEASTFICLLLDGLGDEPPAEPATPDLRLN